MRLKQHCKTKKLAPISGFVEFDIPEDWSVDKISVLASEIKDGPMGFHLHTHDYVDDGIPIIQIRNLQNLQVIKNELKFISEDKHNQLQKSQVKPNDIIISKTGKLGIIGVVPENFGPANLNQALARIHLKDNDLVPFVSLFLSSHLIQQILLAMGTGRAIQDGLRMGDIRNMRIPIPTHLERIQIIEFVNNKIRKLDEIHQKKENLLKLLTEKRQAIINHAVTKGLDPTAPMKDSGVEWIEKIPKHWDILPLKHPLEIPISDGPHTTPVFLDAGIPFVSAEAVKNGKIDFDYAHFISKENHEEYSKKCKPQRNDILMVKAGNTTGKLALVDVDFEFSVWSPLALIRLNKNNFPKYIFYFMNSNIFQDQINFTVNWNTQPNIGMKDIKNLLIIIPPIKEQKLISDFLDERTTKIDSLIQKTITQIERLQEYHKALISNAVTGKIDVR